MFIDSTNTSAGTTIAAISGTAVTLSANATASSAVSANFAPVRDPQGVGQTGGSLTHIQDATELAPHTHTLTGAGNVANVGSSVAATGGGGKNYAGGPTALSVNSAGSGNPMLVVSPSRVTKMIIKQ
jgi:hypothetical protein